VAVICFVVSFLAVAIGDVAAWRQAHEDARDARDTTALNVKKFALASRRFAPRRRKTGSGGSEKVRRVARPGLI
jgi:hypothetical protein